MSLSEGGHLTHGYKLSFSGKIYDPYFYTLDRETETLNYDEILKIALEVKPKLIITGYSAYSKLINFAKFREIANEVGAYLHADIAHISGLVAAGLHPSPVGYADVITSTTHKTLRGPRGGIIMTNNESLSKKIDRAVFPGQQGGPLMHVVAAKAIAFEEALKPNFIKYQQQILDNAKAMAEQFKKLGYKVVSDGTENHLFILDVYKTLGINGLDAQTILEKVNITCNKNNVPFDEQPPKLGSGIRIGTAAMTTRGLKENDMILIADLIHKTLVNNQNEIILKEVKEKVLEIIKDRPLYYNEDW